MNSTDGYLVLLPTVDNWDTKPKADEFSPARISIRGNRNGEREMILAVHNLQLPTYPSRDGRLKYCRQAWYGPSILWRHVTDSSDAWHLRT